MSTNNKSKQVDRTNSSHSIIEYLACGYLIHCIEKVDNKWKCIYCLLIIKEPIQLTECGHRCCRGCFESRAAEAVDNMMVCPASECGITFNKNQVKIIFMFTKSCKYKLHIFFYFKDDA
jgi:hypothetical protein